MKTAIISILIMTSFFPLMAEEVNPYIWEAAEAGLNIYLQKIPTDMLAKYGFNSTSELKKAKLGKPINLLLVKSESSELLNEENKDDSLFINTTLWYFPVKVNGKTASFLIVDKVNENWKAVSLGHASLAEEVANISSAWSEKEGYTYQLAVNYQAKEFYFSIPQINFKNLTPIEFKQNKLFKKADKYKSLEKAEKTLKSVKARAKALKETF